MPSKAQQLAAEINKMMGKGTVLLGSDSKFRVSYTPTGLLPFDVLFQGGLPRGRFVMMVGDYSTLKSYVGLNAIAQVQQVGGVAALIDTEHAYDPEWAESIGVDTGNLILEHPDNGELAIDVAEVMVRNGVDLIVFDSVAATLPQAEANKRLYKENIQPGQQAKLMSAACRRLTTANGKTAVLWINQVREKIGMTFGPSETVPGGRALGFYASMIVKVNKAGKLTRDVKYFTGDKDASTKELFGQTYRATIDKSKLNRPHREIYFDFNLESDPPGIDLVKFLFAQGVDLGLIKKKGNTWSYGKVSAVGKEKFLTRLRADSGKLENQIREAHGLPLLPGKSVRVKKKAEGSKSKPLKGAGLVRIPVRDRDGSGTTARPLKKLSKSKTR